MARPAARGARAQTGDCRRRRALLRAHGFGHGLSPGHPPARKSSRHHRGSWWTIRV